MKQQITYLNNHNYNKYKIIVKNNRRKIIKKNNEKIKREKNI